VELQELGLISRIDRAALALYCQAWGHMVLMEESINASMAGRAALAEARGEKFDPASAFYFTTDKGYQAQTVAVQMLNTLRGQVHTYLKAFGMDPSSRSRVTPSNGGQLGLPGIDAAPGWGQFSQGT
jgi:P27 family predicted phage terminase small subunit